MTYFTPDRSNRPGDDDDHTGGTTEIGAATTKTTELADGRVAVTEAASVDGCTLVYYYFDKTGLEEASKEELQALLERSGINFFGGIDEDTDVGFSSSEKEDARGRAIWEFQVTYS